MNAVIALGMDERPERGSICLVAHDLAYVERNGGIGTYFWSMAFVLAKAGWSVHVLYCGPAADPAALSTARARMDTAGITLVTLDEIPLAAHTSLPQMGDGAGGIRLGLQVMNALLRLHGMHHFDLIEFADWQGVGFRAVQAKRRGLGFADVDLLVKLHAPSRWDRQGNGSWINTLDDHRVDFCERYAFENCDTQCSPTHYIARWVADQGWDVRDNLLVSYPFPTVDADPPPVLPIEELVFLGHLELRSGLDVFLDALDELDDSIPIVFLGKDTYLPSGHRASAIIRERLANRPFTIETEFDRGETLAYLCEGRRLAVIASRSETFGFTVAECVAHQIPFVACEAESYLELFEAPTTLAAWLVPPTAMGLAEGIRRALGSDVESEAERRRNVYEECAARSAIVVEHYAEALQRSRGRARRHLGPPAAKRPLATVAVTHYNLGTELAELLPTLAAQSYANIEVLVIDDGSTDEESLDRFNDLRHEYPEFKFLEQANEGPGPARNRLLYSCSGELFISVDADNLALPHMVERFVDSMGAPDKPDALSCFYLAFTDRSQLVSERFDYQYAPTGGPLLLACSENVFGDANAVFRTEVFRASGGFECDALSPCEDWETFVRFISNGARFDVIPEPLFRYRLRPTGRSRALGRANPLDLQRRLLAQFFDRPIDDEMGRRLWETAISFRALEHRHGVVHEQLSAMTQHAQQLQAHADQLTAQLANPPLRYRVTDRVDRVARRFPLLKNALKRIVLRTGTVARRVAQRHASREDLSG